MATKFESSPTRRRSLPRRILKDLEQILKRTVISALNRIAAPAAGPEPDWNAPVLRVLFLRHDRIGDMILSTGVIRAIAASHPGIELDVLASPVNAAVLEKDPLVHRVLRFDVRRLREYPALWRHLRRTRYDIVVDCMVFSQSLTTMLLMLATGAPHRVGVAKPGKPHIYTMPTEPADKKAHHVEHLARLAVPFGVPAQEALQLQVALTDAEREAALAQWGTATPRVLINVCAGKAFRHWPDRNFVAATRHFKERLPGARLLILHAPADRDRAQAIAENGGAVRALTPGLREALALAATAQLIFTPDTSILHAASAFRIPTATIIPKDHVVRWGLYRTPGELIPSSGDTLATASLEQALAAIDRLLHADGAASAPAEPSICSAA